MSLRHIAVTSCILVLLLCLTWPALAAEEDGPAAPPDGVSVTVLPADPDEATQTEVDKAVDRAKAKPDDSVIDLAYNGVPFGEVLDELSERLELTVVCLDDKVLERRYYRHARVSRTRALAAACATMMVVPEPGYIICRQEEAVAGDLAPEIKSDPKLNVSLQDANLGEALEYLWEKTGVAMAATDAFLESEITYSADATKLSEVMEGMATAVEAKVVRGYILKVIDPEVPLQRLEEMSDEELDKMFREGLSGVQRGQQEGSVPATDEIKQLMLSGMQDAVRNFSDLSPQERREHVQRGATLIRRFAGITHRLAPDTQQQLRSQVQPFLGVIVAGYVAMPTQQRAELYPLMDALKSFGW
jgi:hypothetical protein